MPKIAAHLQRNCVRPVSTPTRSIPTLIPGSIPAACTLDGLARFEPAMLGLARLRSTSARVFISSLTDWPLGLRRGEHRVDLGAPLRKPGDLGLGLRDRLAQGLIALAHLG